MLNPEVAPAVVQCSTQGHHDPHLSLRRGTTTHLRQAPHCLGGLNFEGGGGCRVHVDCNEFLVGTPLDPPPPNLKPTFFEYSPFPETLLSALRWLRVVVTMQVLKHPWDPCRGC